jgi:hypothetical protein
MKECNIEDYKTAFKCFVQRFLEEKKSIFRLDSKDIILTQESVAYLIDNFINNGYAGKASFIDKIKHQLVIEPKKRTNDQTRRDAVEVLAHIVWLWRLVPTNAKKSTTINLIKEILSLDETLPDIQLENNPFFREEIHGIASTGTYYNTNKPFEIAFVIKFLELYVNNTDGDSEISLLNKITDMAIVTTGSLDEDHNFISSIDEQKNEKPRSASIFNALLHFFDSSRYEAILSNEHKEKIVVTFEDLICDDKTNGFKPEIDWKIKCIKSNLGGDSYKDDIYFFYQPSIKKLWDNDGIEVNKNIIYYGVPGTGKTYGVMKEIEEQEDIEYKFVQFHPSYGYEDFIEGIKPVKLDDKTKDVNLQLVNGEFKKMCIDAFAELKKAKEEEREAKRFYFIADEINRAELSRVFGELLVCLEEDKRLKINGNQIEGILIKTQYSSMWDDEHIVVKVDKNNEISDDGEGYFGVPENIYFIGTMNDIDKSIDSFDLALRRRFVWIKKECDYKVIKGQFNNNDYKKSCENLNKKILEIIGKNYQLGHSYFLKAMPINKKIPNISKEILFKTELKPILEEYLRSVVDESEIQEKLVILKKAFIPEDKQNDKNS